MKHYESISEYNDVIYNSRPVKLDDYLSDKYNIVHNELYNDALGKFLKDHISKYINWEFLYHMFTLINNEDEYDDIFEAEFKKENSYIAKALDSLEISKTEFVEKFINVIDELIYELKMILAENINVSHLSDIIRLTIGNIYDFRIRFENGIYVGTENENNQSFVISENDANPFLFVIDLNDRILNIKFDRSGNWLLKFEDDYDFSTIDEQELSQNIMDNTNISLLEKVQNLAVELFKKYHKIIEIKNTEYWMESDIIVIHNSKPFSKHVYNLKDFWNYYQKFANYDISDIKVTNENINDSYVSYVDYINGTAKMYSKTNNLDYNVKFKYLNENSKLGDELLMTNTFTSQI